MYFMLLPICSVSFTHVPFGESSLLNPDVYHLFFFLMIRRPPRSTLDRSSAASDVYKRQILNDNLGDGFYDFLLAALTPTVAHCQGGIYVAMSVSYTHLRAHETVLDLVCRLLLENKTHSGYQYQFSYNTNTRY